MKSKPKATKKAASKDAVPPRRPPGAKAPKRRLAVPRARASRARAEALPDPYPIKSVNPLTGKRWALPDLTIRKLLTHCRDFADAFDGVFVAWTDDRLMGHEKFVAWADDIFLRCDHDAAPKATLSKIEHHAKTLARLLSLIAWHKGQSLGGTVADEFWDQTMSAAERPHRVTGSLIVGKDVGDPIPTVSMIGQCMWVASAAGVLGYRPKLKRGQRDGRRLQLRQSLIHALWRSYPESLRELRLGSHYVESLRLILGKPESGRRALLQEARRAISKYKAAHKISP